MAESGDSLDTLNARGGIRVMLAFLERYRPQHGDSDVVLCSWGPRSDHFEFAVSRRMTRHDHPETTVSLVFEYRMTPSRSVVGESGYITEREATALDGYRAIASATPLRVRVVECTNPLDEHPTT